jgi:hypothetical protein
MLAANNYSSKYLWAMAFLSSLVKSSCYGLNNSMELSWHLFCVI